MIKRSMLFISAPQGTEKFSGMATAFVRRILSDEPGGEIPRRSAVFRVPYHLCVSPPVLGDSVREKESDAVYKIVGVTENAVGGFPHYRVEAR